MRGNGAVHVCAGICATSIVSSTNAMQKETAVKRKRDGKKVISVHSATELCPYWLLVAHALQPKTSRLSTSIAMIDKKDVYHHSAACDRLE